MKTVYDNLSATPPATLPFKAIKKSSTSDEDDYDELPQTDVDFSHLFRTVDPMTLVQLFQGTSYTWMSFTQIAILQERRIIVIGNVENLVPSLEAMITLLFPFSWPYVYVPLLPVLMLDFLDTPLPFIVGLCKESFETVSHASLSPKQDVCTYFTF
jgi:hypothetical protein